MILFAIIITKIILFFNSSGQKSDGRSYPPVFFDKKKYYKKTKSYGLSRTGVVVYRQGREMRYGSVEGRISRYGFQMAKTV